MKKSTDKKQTEDKKIKYWISISESEQNLINGGNSSLGWLFNHSCPGCGG